MDGTYLKMFVDSHTAMDPSSRIVMGDIFAGLAYMLHIRVAFAILKGASLCRIRLVRSKMQSWVTQGNIAALPSDSAPPETAEVLRTAESFLTAAHKLLADQSDAAWAAMTPEVKSCDETKNVVQDILTG